MNSSAKNGKTKAPANGHPRTAPAPNHMIPAFEPCVRAPVRSTPIFQSMKAAAPTILIFIAKLEGKNAALAWKSPVLDTMITPVKIATRGFSVRLIAVTNLAWHVAQTHAMHILSP